MQATVEARRSQLPAFVIAFALFGVMIMGGAGGYLIKSLQVQSSAPVAVSSARSTTGMPAIDQLTGYPAGSVADQRVLASLKRSGYEGGGTVIGSRVDPLTGHPVGGADDQPILPILSQHGFVGEQPGPVAQPECIRVGGRKGC